MSAMEGCKTPANNCGRKQKWHKRMEELFLHRAVIPAATSYYKSCESRGKSSCESHGRRYSESRGKS